MSEPLQLTLADLEQLEEAVSWRGVEIMDEAEFSALCLLARDGLEAETKRQEACKNVLADAINRVKALVFSDTDSAWAEGVLEAAQVVEDMWRAIPDTRPVGTIFDPSFSEDKN